MTAKKRFLLCVLLAVVATKNIVTAWKQCSPEEGGGICPDGNTCCPTGTPGLSSCIPGRARDPDGAGGQCCDTEGATGCPFGYECAVHEDTKPIQICKRKEPHTEDLNAKETPRYRLCRLSQSPSSSSSDDDYRLQNFPIDGFNAVYYSNMGSIYPNETNAQKFANVEIVLVMVHGSGRNADDYLCAGMSTAEAISNFGQSTNGNRTKLLSTNDKHGKFLVIAPRFLADIDHEDRKLFPNTLYWWERGKDIPLSHTWRYGADAANTLPKRGDSKNQTGGISSYAVMDRLLEHIIGSKHSKGKTTKLRRSLEQREDYSFPNLKRIVVAGHSAGGQYVHRWSLLSSSPVIWGEGGDLGDKDSPVRTNAATVATNHRKVEMRMVVANPRSYCYPDNRRMIRTGTFSNGQFRHVGTNPSNTDNSVNKKADSSLDNGDSTVNSYSYRFEIPDSRDIDACPTYDQWQWGLEPGGDVLCPYKDNALDLVQNNMTALALRYSKRKVFYLAGQHDTIVQDDRCETYDFQGDHRNERARRYYRALTEYLATLETDRAQSTSNKRTKQNLIHEFHQVPGSPHDHTLMFQSAPAREAFYGTGLESNDSNFERNHEKKLENGVDSESLSRINPRNMVEYAQIK